MELENIIRLIREVSQSELTCFLLEEGNLKLTFEKKSAEMQPQGQIVTVAQKQTEITEQEVTQQTNSSQNPVITVSTESAKKEEITIEQKQKGEAIKSPLVGTFYNAPSPEEAPFVKIGDTVKKGQVLGIIEAMKLMNEIEAERDGIIEAILVENEQMVEYGQELFRII